MSRFFRFITVVIVIVFVNVIVARAEDYYVQTKMTVTDSEGTTTEGETSFEGSAPITAKVTIYVANASGTEDPDATFNGQWRVWKKGESTISEPLYQRADNPTEFYFNDGGTYYIAWVGTVTSETLGGEVVYDEAAAQQVAFSVTAATSVLTFPNAFSPNGDGYNDIYQAKEVKSIVQFSATIYSRWGQKLYTWTNPNEGWDGTYNGKAVNDGVYYVQVKARGADGTEYDIKKDVNLLRGYINSETTTQ